MAYGHLRPPPSPSSSSIAENRSRTRAQAWALGAVLAPWLAASHVAAQTAVPEPAPQAAAADDVLPEIRVRAAAPPAEGRAVEGYRPSAARQVGPLGERQLKDTPYAISVVPRELIDNLQATRPDDVFRLNPVTQLNSPQTRFFTGVTMRGFSVGSTKRIDGLPSGTTYVNTDLEDKESIEVLTGLSGFLYGAGNVGGTLNYVMKRPTAERLATVTAGLTEGRNALVHGDFGGRLDEGGRIGYRANLVAQGGETAVDDQSLRRRLASLALDWQATERLLLQLDASASRYRLEGTEPYWAAAAGVRYPDAPDAGTFWGQPWTRTQTSQRQLGLRLEWALADGLGLRAGVQRRDSSMDLVVANNTLTDDTGAYSLRSSAWEYPDVHTRAAYVYLDSRFTTGPLAHKLTVGLSADRNTRSNFRGSGWNTAVFDGFSLDAGSRYVNEPALPVVGDKYTANRSRQRQIVVGDEIQFGPRWSVLAGASHVRLVDRSYEADGSRSADYEDSKLSPSVAVLYKLRPDLTLYASTMRSFEQGGTAPPFVEVDGVPVALVNAGEVMPPLVSKQVEVGAKATLGGVLATAALFEIDKANEYTDATDPAAPRYVQDGRQVHRGLEFTATGRATRRLTVWGGVTLLEAEIREQQDAPALEGKTPVDVAERQAKLYTEYDLIAVPGLTLTGGAVYTGPQAVDALNTDEVPGFTTFDAGLRYATRAGGLPLVLRAKLSNLTDKSYWLGSHYSGRPRSLAMSAQVTF